MLKHLLGKTYLSMEMATRKKTVNFRQIIALVSRYCAILAEWTRDATMRLYQVIYKVLVLKMNLLKYWKRN